MAIHRDYESEARQIFLDLAAIGLQVETFAQLRRMGEEAIKEAGPVLLKWLSVVGNDDLKEDIVRSLSMPWFKSDVAKAFIEEFEKSDNLFLKWAIGNGLSIVADDTIADDLLRLAQQHNHGRSREMLVLALARLQNPRAVQVARRLLQDEDVQGHAVMALGKLRAKEARSDIATMTSHPKAWIRAEAKKALQRIDKPPRPDKSARKKWVN